MGRELTLKTKEQKPKPAKKKKLAFSEKRKKSYEKKKRRKEGLKTTHNAISPSQQQFSSLLGHYQAERYGDAEKLALSMTQDFPEHPFAWKAVQTKYQFY